MSSTGLNFKNNINQENYENFIDYTILHGYVGLGTEISPQDRENIISEFELRKNWLSSNNAVKFQGTPVKDNNFRPKINLTTKEEINYHQKVNEPTSSLFRQGRIGGQVHRYCLKDWTW